MSPTNISVKQAVQKAMAVANHQLAAKIDKNQVLNCGEDNDHLWHTDEAALSNAWSKQSFEHGDVVYSPRAVNASSGEAKFDLRFADGNGPAVFNYHVPFLRDTRAADAAAAQSAKDKKLAEAHKAELARQAEAKKRADTAAATAKRAADAVQKRRDQAMATAWNKALKAKSFKPSDKAKWEKAWNENADKKKISF